MVKVNRDMAQESLRTRNKAHSKRSGNQLSKSMSKGYSERFTLPPTGDYEANVEGLLIKFKNGSEKFKRVSFLIENCKEKDING
jgi:hypothetical protein